MVVANAPFPANKPHKHAALIKAWADGAEIECFYTVFKDWLVVKKPSWNVDLNYRIKPTKPKDKHMDALIVLSPHAGLMLYDAAPDEANCVLVFDGTTGKLVDASVKGCLNSVEQAQEALDNPNQWQSSWNAFKRTGEL
jgi:hypothetical protein